MAATAFATAQLGIAGYSAYKTATAPKQKAPVVPIIPQAPTPDLRASVAAHELAQRQEKARALKVGQRSTILTSPQGITGAPTPGRTTLLGQ